MGCSVTDKLITPNGTLVVSLADFKQHLRWDASETSEDTVMTAYLTATQEQAQLFTGRQFLNSTWQLLIDTFPGHVSLSKTPFSSLTSVKYYDSNDQLQTLDPSEYKVKDGGTYGFTSIYFDGNIPSVYDKPDAVVIEYVAGYGSLAADVPEPIKVAIMLTAASYFENRTNEVTGSINQIMYGGQQLLYPYKTFYNNL